jgi:cob(I)alamin adenosyltransferase
MNTLFAKIYDELKAVPITMMFLAGVYIQVAILSNDHVSKKDFVELKGQLTGVQYTLRRDHADSELHKIEADLFGLSQHIKDEQAKGRDVDRLYYERIDDLKNRHEDLMREVNRLDQMSRENSSR